MIELNNFTDFTVDKNLFLGVAKRVLKGENEEMEPVSIAFVAPEEIQELNKKYRDKDQPTDVLSFENVKGFLGGVSQVIICPAYIKKSFPTKKEFEKELVRVLVHGLLHVVGYDHDVSLAEEEKMFKKEQEYIGEIRSTLDPQGLPKAASEIRNK